MPQSTVLHSSTERSPVEFQNQMKSWRPLGIASLPGLLTILVAFGIIFIGVREFLYPGVGAQGFGVSLADPRDGDLLAIKAARDVVSGIVALIFLALRDRRSLAWVMGGLSLIPFLDGLIVLRHAGWAYTPVILIHWGTVILMLAIVALLGSGK